MLREDGGVKLQSRNITSLYYELKDEDMVEAARAGDYLCLNYLIEKYQSLVGWKSKQYFIKGGDGQDLFQEGMIGLYKAILNYDRERKSTFRGFAILCIGRQMKTAITAANRQKHQFLNSYIHIEKLRGYRALENFNPETVVIGKEMAKKMKSKIFKALSQFEIEVFLLYLQGERYHEIGKKLKRDSKSIDNAIQRVKRKAGKCLNLS